MGLAALIGVLLAGAFGDKTGPVMPTIASFVCALLVSACC